MSETPRRCRHCASERLTTTSDSWNVVREVCLDCGYTREQEPDEGNESTQETAA